MWSVQWLSESKVIPALKHGGYSATTILPGESAADFARLHRDLIAELTPNGALEDDIVATMAKLLWRKQNLATLRIAERVRDRCSELLNLNEDDSGYEPSVLDREKIQVAESKIRREFGDACELVEVGEIATVECLLNDLDVQDRLDAMVDKCVKRLLTVRGLKSISAAPPARRLPGPPKAA